MDEKRMACVCTDCGNEADMILTCNETERVGKATDIDVLKEHEENCRICRDEANMILNF